MLRLWPAFTLASVTLTQAVVAAGEVVRGLEDVEASMATKFAELERMIQIQQDKIDAQDRTLASQNQKLAGVIEEEHQERRLQAHERRLNAEATPLTHVWLILCGALVMFMQAGFALVEAGSCRAKNAQLILAKNLVDVCVGTLGWYFTGFAFAYGGPSGMKDDGTIEVSTGITKFTVHDVGVTRFSSENAPGAVLSGNHFIGFNYFFGHEFSEADESGAFTVHAVGDGSLYLTWFFQWAFCTTAATIVSGGVAERLTFPVYLIYSFIMTSLIYPVGVAWTWGFGWLGGGEGVSWNIGSFDYAGSGIVHMAGGVGALVGAIIAGPRTGRFDPKQAQRFEPHSLPLIVLGTFILWFGWYGFNCGSSLKMSSNEDGYKSAMVAMNTTISASCGGLVVLGFRYLLLKKYDVGGMCNGILGGLVSITASCANVESGSAMLIGLLGGCIMQCTSMLMKKLKVDDPVDAFAVHGACGIWGVLAAVFFDFGHGASNFNGWSGFSCMVDSTGNCDSGAWGGVFAANLMEILCISLWVITLTSAVLLPFKFGGLLVASEALQASGMDTKCSRPEAYVMKNKPPKE